MNLKLSYVDETMEGIPKEVLEGARKVGENRKSFRRMLETYVPRVGYSAPKNPRILDLGCGRSYEAHVLSSYFGNQPDGWDSKDVLVIGIDIDEKEIKRARDDHSSPDFSEQVTKYVEKPNYRFIRGDATKLRELVDGEFDIVVARHPNVAELPDTWYAIFREANDILKADGLFIATSFSDIEHKMLEEQVQRAGYKIALSSENIHSIPTTHKEVSIDRKILLARK